MWISSAFTLDAFTQHSACLLPQWMQHHSHLNMRPLIDAVTLLLYPVLVCCLWCLTRNIDCITIPYNVRRGMLDAMIFSCGHYWVTQAICKGKHYQALIQISAISQGTIKTKRVIEIYIKCVTTMNISNMDTRNVHCALTYHQEWLVPWHPPYPLEGIACDTACTTEWTEWWFQPAQWKDSALVAEDISCCVPQGPLDLADHPEEMAGPGARASYPQRGPSEVIFCSFEGIGKCKPGKE